MKPCNVNNCIWPIFSHGYCKMHQYKRQDEKYDRRTPFQKHFDNAKKKIKVDDTEEETELQKWFSDKMINSKMKCENCGADLGHYNEKDWHGSQHHILEKSLYPSVKTNPINHLVLGKWCCHSQWHTSWENAAKMRIFPKAIDIISILYPTLKQEEKRKLPEIVIQELKPEICNSK